MFGPHKGIPSLAVNRLARWALFLSQFEYDIEYRKTKDHANADALSQLPSGGDVKFDKEESEQDVDIVCTCNSSLCNQFWKTEAAETGVYSRILRVFQNLLPPDVINICIFDAVSMRGSVRSTVIGLWRNRSKYICKTFSILVIQKQR